jgi:Holliday junction resolvasome RuvABC endonuclease subunit
MTYIYGLDLSLSNSGVAIFSDDARLIHLMSIDTKMVKEHQEKLKIIADAMLELKEKYPPRIAIFEKGFFRYIASTEAIFKVVGLVQYIFSDYEQVFYSPMTVKKWVAGKGNVKKDEVYRVVSKIYPEIMAEDFDQSDAISVGLCYFYMNNLITRKDYDE